MWGPPNTNTRLNSDTFCMCSDLSLKNFPSNIRSTLILFYMLLLAGIELIFFTVVGMGYVLDLAENSVDNTWVFPLLVNVT